MANKKLRVTIIGVGNRASSLYFFKTPPKQIRDDICREKVHAFINGNISG